LDKGDTVSLQYGEGKIFVTSWGRGDKTILLMHGWGGNRAQMTYLVDSLISNDFTVIALDAPAHGESFGSQTNIVEIVEAINIVNEKFGPINNIISHSFGGPSSLLAMDRGLVIEKIVTISAPTDADRSLMKPFKDLLNLPDKVVRRVKTNAEDMVGQKMEEIQVKNLAKTQTIPCLIIHDTEDVVITELDAREMHENWKDSELYLTKGYGHRQILREEDVHTKIVEFLK